MQELQTMNVQMRVITEDNIDQLTSMSYSDNIEKLTNNQHNTPVRFLKWLKDSWEQLRLIQSVLSFKRKRIHMMLEYVPTGDWDDSFSTQDFNQGSLFQQPAPSTPEFRVYPHQMMGFALSSHIRWAQPASPDYAPPTFHLFRHRSPDYAPPNHRRLQIMHHRVATDSRLCATASPPEHHQ